MSSDFFKKLQPLFEAKDSDLEKAVCKAEDKKKADKEDAAVKALDKKPANVKENAADFFRKYSNIVTEAEEACDGKDWYIDTTDGDRKAGPFNSEKEAHDHLYNLKKKTSREETSSMKVVCESYGDDDDEDPDVKKAEATKGKDGKKQADFEKGKKWNFDKADKNAEDKAAKKAAKDKDLTEGAEDSEPQFSAVTSKKYVAYTGSKKQVEDYIKRNSGGADGKLHISPIKKVKTTESSYHDSDIDAKRDSRGNIEGASKEQKDAYRKAPEKEGYTKSLNPKTGGVMYVKKTDKDLAEAAKWRDPKYKDKLYTQDAEDEQGWQSQVVSHGSKEYASPSSLDYDERTHAKKPVSSKEDPLSNRRSASVKRDGKATANSINTLKHKIKSSAVTESYDYDDEDDDVKKAEATKGKDGKKQADFEKGKKFDFSKLDKKGEDKGAKKAAKDKDLTESAVKRKVSRASLEVDGIDHADSPDFSDAYFSYGEYTDGTPLSDDQLDRLTDKHRDLVHELAYDQASGGLWDQGGKDLEESAQINEYLTKEGVDITDMMMLNLFTDLGTEEGNISDEFPEWAEDPAWQAIAAKYVPIAAALEAKINAQTGRTLTREEAAAIDGTWYDGSDVYDDVQYGVQCLPARYDLQIEVIEAILDHDLAESVTESDNDEQHTDATADTKQIRNIVRQAAQSVGAKLLGVYTSTKPPRNGRTRLGFMFRSEQEAEQVRKATLDAIWDQGFVNHPSVTSSDDNVWYVRIDARVSSKGNNVAKVDESAPARRWIRNK